MLDISLLSSARFFFHKLARTKSTRLTCVIDGSFSDLTELDLSEPPRPCRRNVTITHSHRSPRFNEGRTLLDETPARMPSPPPSPVVETPKKYPIGSHLSVLDVCRPTNPNPLDLPSPPFDSNPNRSRSSMGETVATDPDLPNWSRHNQPAPLPPAQQIQPPCYAVRHFDLIVDPETNEPPYPEGVPHPATPLSAGLSYMSLPPVTATPGEVAQLESSAHRCGQDPWQRQGTFPVIPTFELTPPERMPVPLPYPVRRSVSETGSSRQRTAKEASTSRSTSRTKDSLPLPPATREEGVKKVGRNVQRLRTSSEVPHRPTSIDSGIPSAPTIPIGKPPPKGRASTRLTSANALLHRTAAMDNLETSKFSGHSAASETGSAQSFKTVTEHELTMAELAEAPLDTLSLSNLIRRCVYSLNRQMAVCETIETRSERMTGQRGITQQCHRMCEELMSTLQRVKTEAEECTGTLFHNALCYNLSTFGLAYLVWQLKSLAIHLEIWNPELNPKDMAKDIGRFGRKLQDWRVHYIAHSREPSPQLASRRLGRSQSARAGSSTSSGSKRKAVQRQVLV
ncbi:hypothetical protein DFP72DRAFT_882926, partial [Ephemerocybe angulata]